MVELKTLTELKVAYISGKAISKVDAAEKELLEKLDSKGPAIGIFYDSPADVGYDNVRWDICVPVEDSKGLDTKTLPTTQAVSIIHTGSFDTLEKSFAEIFKWISENNYKQSGPVREIYFGDKTEIQIPVIKAEE